MDVQCEAVRLVSNVTITLSFSVWCERKFELTDCHRYDHAQLHHCEWLPGAVVGTIGERNEGVPTKDEFGLGCPT